MRILIAQIKMMIIQNKKQRRFSFLVYLRVL
jgi:hypothetical protein